MIFLKLFNGEIKFFKMLQVPMVDICIESPKQNEYVNTVSNKNRKDYILGRGSYGRVYKAIYRDQSVAVKILQKSNKEIANSVARESNILGWNHENIIQILKITSLDDCFTIIMERFPGICLQQLLNQMKIPLWHRIRISSDVVNGLRFCHARNLVHLDVKPQNILVAFGCDSSNFERNYFKCKLFDFGCSTFINKNSSRSNQCGTIRYMSPDTLQGFTVGLHDDIYSFGITMWQLKTHTDPYCNISSNDFVAYHVVKSNLRPDTQLEDHGINESSSDILGLDTLTGYTSNRNKMTIERPYSFLTPNIKTKPSDPKFLSTGHTKKHRTIKTVMSSKAIKKLDFNVMSSTTKCRSPLIFQSVNVNVPVVKQIKNNTKEIALDKENYVNFFKDTYLDLPLERKIEIENAYCNIYKECWQQEAVKRPSSHVVFDLLQSILNLFD